MNAKQGLDLLRDAYASRAHHGTLEEPWAVNPNITVEASIKIFIDWLEAQKQGYVIHQHFVDKIAQVYFNQPHPDPITDELLELVNTAGLAKEYKQLYG